MGIPYRCHTANPPAVLVVVDSILDLLLAAGLPPADKHFVYNWLIDVGFLSRVSKKTDKL